MATDGDHEIAGSQGIGDVLLFADGTPQRTAGPLAKGFVTEDATITGAVNVDSVAWDGSRYAIELTDVQYTTSEYCTVVTPASGDHPALTENSGDGTLLIEFEDLAQHNFQFVVYDLPEGSETTVDDATVEERMPDIRSFTG